MRPHSTTLIGLLFFSALFASAQSGWSPYYKDNSDWWSGLRTIDSDTNIKTLPREPATSNFRILEIDLGKDTFAKAKAKLGKATEVQRGDAALGRDQICYVSSDAEEKVHLIFEQGEIDFSYYLFVGGADWNGSDQCATSKLISRNLAVASGLHLGQTPAEIMAILGKPSLRRKDELLYSFMVEKKTSRKDLEQASKNNPEMSDEDFHKNYDFYTLSVGIDAKFKDNKLIYLTVSKSEAT
jgi:hypothetical protein